MTDLTDLQTIEFELADHVATVTLNRPDRLNSFNELMSRELTAVWQRVRDDEDIRVAVLRGNGERAFCTGLDVSEGTWWTHQPIFNQEDPGAVLGPKAHRVWKPVIAALHGMVAGGAMYFVNECDFAICSESATFFDPHVNSGAVSALEPMGMLALGVPYGEVMRWALMGSEERMSAHTALRIGLVTEIVPDNELRSRAAELAAEIAARRPKGVQGTVRAMWEARDLPPIIAARHGLSYTHIGNPGEGRSDSRANKKPPRIR
ncbi:enoyl-CoA hydratase/isomerase family protein [Mycobacterium heckeshornense]|uniref:Enoyl-CoA hydratase n=1 Tax=Mycobacterium heckeshornense TaxID=110505 RepID=A0A2G8B520_9MYCO|nr:enoyl-CoA hydratase/isomerase family protein [Mycobacterium heckeshornense]KMV24206.1 enoyl-CoA hydratase [Mycobacterium heckeshornense]MCV7036435.1 enoyl-CoA hydratase/isomerase family protein [Mycobacterium heckeshornense]PIJ32736.1 enoyl-CoA hydratase/isomerase family protein [Mycobacterium heckeshornense]BCO34296.1 enoyl-CoA hydratase [Mycobacterium heckeshornense]BCQ07433.1 enoyl-CoA hydratase [Mycobacterium heckeshornense]